MVSKVPVIEQCVVSSNVRKDIMIEDLAGYLERNKKLVFPHRHNFYHLLLFTKGGGKHTIDFETFEVVPWQIYFMSPGQIHTWSFEGEMDGYVVNFDRDFFKTFLLQPDYITLFSFFSGLVRDEVFVVKTEERSAVLALFERLRRQTVNVDFARVSLLYIFHLLEQQRDRPAVLPEDTYNHTLLRNFLNLIESNFRTLRLPKDYAALLYITPNHLNALCKQVLGISAGEIIRQRVLLEAKRLLAIKDYGISEIAYELNFNDNSYFTKFFKKGEGITPEEFRKQHT
ncbi:helix-turn-helix domain-containing protein [Sphingobacterium sp. DN00404]|uniref:Helix-turn-helix domain-containing protein n=1 Tax=Sphingobacterium micropteri TaxID=2763501 RepID=A0ABR7YP97_9SPHI|nr:helix-turn-helix transcriptional regulator [Sphingobacterium micropteri]MBD1433112.1 helix-turn-helix domain-containing protein [Sphingobacterium micropteri]